MRRLWVALAATVLLGLAGCAGTGTGTGSGTGAPPTSPGNGGPATGSPGSSGEPGGGGSTVDPVTQFRVRYGWDVPSRTVTVDNPVGIPQDPNAIPLPYLVEIRTGDHANENPGYGRISFYFKGTFPGYRFEYTDKVLSEGQGAVVPLEGNAFLHLVFNPAQAHDNAGKSTITFAAPKRIGFSTLRSYGFAGDFEGYVAYGLGLQVKPGSDQALPIRISELKRGDLFIVAVDIRSS